MNKDDLQALGLDEAQIASVLEAHGAAQAALKKEYDEYRASQEALRQEYDEYRAGAEKVRQEYDEYRESQEAARLRSAKRAAYHALLDRERVPHRFHERVMRDVDFDALALRGDRLEDEDALRRAVRRDWGDFVGVPVTRGVSVDTPPAVDPPGGMTVREIMAIADDARREREIARNHELFGF